MPSHPDPFGEDQQAEIEESRAKAIRQDAEKQAALRLLDREVCEKYRVLGDKVLVRLVDDSLTVSSGGIFLTEAYNGASHGVLTPVVSRCFFLLCLKKELLFAQCQRMVLLFRVREGSTTNHRDLQ